MLSTRAPQVRIVSGPSRVFIRHCHDENPPVYDICVKAASSAAAMEICQYEHPSRTTTTTQTCTTRDHVRGSEWLLGTAKPPCSHSTLSTFFFLLQMMFECWFRCPRDVPIHHWQNSCDSPRQKLELVTRPRPICRTAELWPTWTTRQPTLVRPRFWPDG